MNVKTKERPATSKTKEHLAILRQNPTLFQVNTRVWLTELSKELGKPATLDDVPDTFLDWLADKGFAWAYFLSVWQTGEAGRRISREHPGWKDGFRADLPDLTDNDVCGSGFAITDYKLNKDFGTTDSLPRLKERLNERGLKLMLDLVPNHTAIDHGWVKTHPEYYVQGNEEALAYAPQNFIKVGERIFAHGRDPYFDGWPDTLQLDYGNPDFCKAMRAEIAKIATTCDGLRCDMAMLILPDVFQRTWGNDIEPFWPETIASIRKAHPDFAFMAEVYWDREWDLQQQGFDFTYDKRLYDRLRQDDARIVREHFWADMDYQRRSARFLENHDEPRAACTFAPEQHKAAAVITFLSPGLRFLHQGQLEGYRKRVSVHLNRKPPEPVDRDIEKFYDRLLYAVQLPVVHKGDWRLLECAEAWGGNWTSSCFIAYSWTAGAADQVIVIVNYAPHQSQCFVKVKLPDSIKLKSILDGTIYSDANAEGLSVDLPPWGHLVLRTTW